MNAEASEFRIALKQKENQEIKEKISGRVVPSLVALSVSVLLRRAGEAM